MWKRYVYLDQATDLPPAGGAPAAAQTVSAPGAGQAGAGAVSYPASLLAQGQTAAVVPLHEAVPEKFRVFKGEGESQQFDAEGSLRKVAQSYAELEKHKGAVGNVPASPEEYALNPVEVEGFDFEAFKSDPGTQTFLKGAHAKGMTNEQVSYVIDSYLQTAPELVQAAAMLDDKVCATELRKAWPEDEAFKSNLSGAYKAFSAYAEKAGVTLEQAEAAGIANNPVFLRLMAAIAPEMQEDSGVHVGDMSTSSGQTITELLASEAYRNPKHADHAATSAKVKSYYERNFKGLPG